MLILIADGICHSLSTDYRSVIQNTKFITACCYINEFQYNFFYQLSVLYFIFNTSLLQRNVKYCSFKERIKVFGLL